MPKRVKEKDSALFWKLDCSDTYIYKTRREAETVASAMHQLGVNPRPEVREMWLTTPKELFEDVKRIGENDAHKILTKHLP